ncbi:MAG: hypothetical protein L6U61_09325 [Bacteroidales bacterium]|nr:MAG: hypothetical protein L6U61_09325 [Bacteroidales bacterium]
MASSRLNTDFVLELMSEGLLVSVVRGSRTSYRALDINILKQYLHGKDESFRILDSHSDKATSRASQAYATGNSKLISVRSCPGFPINAYEPIECILNGQEFIIHPLEGSFIFVSDWQSFLVPTDVVIVGIENMENFRKSDSNTNYSLPYFQTSVFCLSHAIHNPQIYAPGLKQYPINTLTSGTLTLPASTSSYLNSINTLATELRFLSLLILK